MGTVEGEELWAGLESTQVSLGKGSEVSSHHRAARPQPPAPSAWVQMSPFPPTPQAAGQTSPSNLCW